MLKKITKWETEDGTIFDTQEEAEDYMFEQECIAIAECDTASTEYKYVELPVPDTYIFQHEETGLVEYVDSQQVEWGFEKNNPRWLRVGEAYTKQQVVSLLKSQGIYVKTSK